MVKNQKSQKLKKIIEYAPVCIFIMICLIVYSLVLIDIIPAGAKKEILEAIIEFLNMALVPIGFIIFMGIVAYIIDKLRDVVKDDTDY